MSPGSRTVRRGGRRWLRLALPLMLLVAVAALWWLYRPGRQAGEGKLRGQLKVEVLASYPHDGKAYTQGLIWHQGKFFESTGGYGSSTVRRVEIESGRVELQSRLPVEMFGEGLSRVGDHLMQLTWRAGTGLIYNLKDLELLEARRYTGEGWGLTYDGESLIMSNGTEELIFVAPDSFSPRRRVRVLQDGQPVQWLNELEWADGLVWANVWHTDTIVGIEPEGGEVVAEVDASGLLSEPERAQADVLNGIAYNPELRHFFLTGKLWPRVFEVVFVPDRE